MESEFKALLIGMALGAFVTFGIMHSLTVYHSDVLDHSAAHYSPCGNIVWNDNNQSLNDH